MMTKSLNNLVFPRILVLFPFIFSAAPSSGQDLNKLDSLTSGIVELWSSGSSDMLYAGEDCGARGEVLQKWSGRVATEMERLNVAWDSLLTAFPLETVQKHSNSVRASVELFFEHVSSCSNDPRFKAAYDQMWKDFSTEEQATE